MGNAENVNLLSGRHFRSNRFRFEQIQKLFYHQFYYGAREVFLDYLELPYSFYIKGVVQHGISPAFASYIRDGCFPSPWFSFKRSPVFLAERGAEALYRKIGFSYARAIGSPWAYLLKEEFFGKLKHLNTSPNHREKVLVFLSSGNQSLSANKLFTLFEQKISKLRESNLKDVEVTVCLRWADYSQLDACKFREITGVHATTLGSGKDNRFTIKDDSRIKFLYRLADLILEHDRVTCDEFGSSIFYSASLDRRVTLIPLSDSFDSRDESSIKWKREELRLRNWLISQVTFKQSHELDFRRLKLLSNELIGIKDTLERGQLIKKLPLCHIEDESNSTF